MPSDANQIGPPPVPRYVCERCWTTFTSPDKSCPTVGCQSRPPGGWPLMPYRFRHFVFQKLLGRGGMGAVFLAIDEMAQQAGEDPRRAVKVVQRLGGPDQVRRAVALFDNEVSAAKVLAQSSRFPRVRGFDDNDPPYLSMEFIEDPTLTSHLKAHGGLLPPMEAARFGLAFLDALDRMHAMRWVHRDLKPDNLFVRRDANGWQVKIADLGLWAMSAEAGGGSIIGNQKLLEWGGTPDYMSPEQLAGNQPLSCRSDIHAAGSIIWQTATGTLPFPLCEGDLTTALKERALAVEHVPPRPRRMPAGLHEVLARSLAPQPAGRFADASAMREALQSFVDRAEEQRRASLAAVGQALVEVEQKMGLVHDRLSRIRALDGDARKLAGAIEALRGQQEAWEPDDLRAAVRDVGDRVDAIRTQLDRVAAGTWSASSPAQAPDKAQKQRRRAFVFGAVMAGLASFLLTVGITRVIGPRTTANQRGPDLARAVDLSPPPTPPVQPVTLSFSSRFTFSTVDVATKKEAGGWSWVTTCDRESSSCEFPVPPEGPFAVRVRGKGLKEYVGEFQSVEEAKEAFGREVLQVDD